MAGDSTVTIGLLFPDVLGTYGDNGNAIVLRQRLRWRGLDADVLPIGVEDPVPASCDVYLLGGGEDAVQKVAADRLLQTRGLALAAAAGAPVLAVCAGMQILGHSFTPASGRPHAGLGLLDIVTVARARRAVGEVVVEPDARLLASRLYGFENHLGGSTISSSAAPLGKVLCGVGNGVGRRDEGVVQGRIVGTYLHGPVLARNPELADLLLHWATGQPMTPIARPDDELRRAHTGRCGRGRWGARQLVSRARRAGHGM